MKVLISRDIFDNSKDERGKLELNFLIYLITVKKCYELLIDDSDILSSDYMKGMGDNETRIFEWAFTQAMTSSAKCDCQISKSGEAETKNKVFTREEAIVYLLQPLSLLVENSVNDAHFLRALFKAYATLESLRDAESNNELQFVNAGGCMNVENFIKAQVAHYKGKIKFLRYWVLLDGDKRFPTDAVNKYNKVTAKLKDWNVEYHILNKRSMENYMPDDAIEQMRIKTNADWINAYRSLSEEQKDYFNIAGGFYDDLTKENKATVLKKEKKHSNKDKNKKKTSFIKPLLSVAQRNLYNDMSKAHFKALEKGIQLPITGSFKEVFPTYYNHQIVTKKDWTTGLADRTIHTSYKTLLILYKNYYNNMNNNISIETQIRSLVRLLADLQEGTLQVPPFQRDFVWTRDDIKELFESIKNNYPIGSLLIWKPKSDYHWNNLKSVGGFKLPKVASQQVFLLDGYQRLSSLFGCLTNAKKSIWKLTSQ